MTSHQLESRPFDLTAADLPTGVTVLEASAGTGKTYTIAGLVTRYVAEGVRLPRLLVVTFTRAATAELRDRVRRRLVEAAAHLEAVVAGADPTTGDELLQLLARGNAAQQRQRLRNLEESLAEFDAATIATIHGFCQHVLGGIGLAGDVDRSPTLIEDDRDIVEAVVDDLMVRTYHSGDGEMAVDRRKLAQIAAAVIGSIDAAIVPEAPGSAEVALRCRLARQVREEVDLRKRALGVLSYDDVLTRLRDALRDPAHSEAARRRLRAKYDVGLIDEFQDTDPVQWEIVSRAFAHDGGTLVLIGDPKQAIYAFRGADVHTYLAAAGSAGPPATLRVNWRSDGPLLQAFNVLFDGAALGHEDIPYRQVVPAPGRGEPRLRGAPDGTPLRVKVVRRDGGVRTASGGRYIPAPAAREHVARDLAAEIVGLLDSEAELIERDAEGRQAGPPRPVEPGDLAVLVRSNAEATLVQRTLREVSVPAVINGVGSVLATVSASDWLMLLEALEQPGSRGRAAALAFTPFLDWGPRRVAEASEDDWDQLHQLIHRWAGILRDRGVAVLARTVSDGQCLPERLLRRTGGERALTDIDHVGQLLHSAGSAEELGVAGLVAWLRRQMAEADDDSNPEERARRLESDADAVQVLTVHRSKGLEFPIVYAPYLWSSNTQPISVPVFHREDGRRAVDVGEDSGSEAYRNHKSDAEKERRGEDIRLLYVALTRARHQVVAWWAPTTNGKHSPLGRVLFCRSARGVRTSATCTLPDDDTAMQRIGEIAVQAGGAIGVAVSPAHGSLPAWDGTRRPPTTLQASRFERAIDQRWRRASYSSLTRAAHEASYETAASAVHDEAVRSEPEESVTEDEVLAGGAAAVGQTVGAEPSTGATASELERRLRAHPLPLADLRGGVDTGTFVHGVFETVDFAAADLTAALQAAVTEQARRHGEPDPAFAGSRLVDGLRRVIETPLGPLAGGSALRGAPRRDRLDELVFELPLGIGGNAGPGTVTVAAIGELLRTHLPVDDPLAGYADSLADAAFSSAVRGYLNGSIDVVLRVPGIDVSPVAQRPAEEPAPPPPPTPAPARYVVADYKTNVLGSPGEPLSAWDYRPAVLGEAMRRGHYPLQALLYVVALHRYLRWRLPGYDPAAHLGGVLYLFVRGMTGAEVPLVGGAPCGVFAWQPPTALVLDLSDLLDRGETAA